MPLTPGSKLGPYEILSAIGAGGMGEVYRAKDTRLDRTVAVKILLGHVADRTDARERFEREARAVSSLNHPNICTLYDVGTHDGLAYLVMEHLEGETLATRLEKGALSPDQTVKIGIEIASALDRAHRSGVVHRDLKPGNIILTKTGAKLLDFGLAKLKASDSTSGEAQVAGLSTLRTEHKDLTAEGTIMGTFQYMAPEQLEGKETDARSDIFALGAVIYEMATGRRAFAGKSQASLIAAILAAEPPSISSIQPMTPPALDRLVKRCLAKEPDDRWQSAGDLASELKWIGEGGSQVGIPAPVVARRKSRERFWMLAAIGATITTIALVAFGYATGIGRAKNEVEPVPLRFTMLPPEETYWRAFNSFALSPDGRHLAFYVDDHQGAGRLYYRSLDTLESRPLPGTEVGNPSFPFWSPDSRLVGFFAGGKLKTISISGGPPQVIADAPDGRGGTWNAKGEILFSPGFNTPIMSVAAAGGEPKAVTKLPEDDKKHTHQWPSFLPDGRHFTYLDLGGSRADVWTRMGDIDGGADERLFSAESQAIYAPPGVLIFLRSNSLLAQPIDAATRKVSGDASLLADRIGQNLAYNYGAFGVSNTGLLAFRTGGAVGRQQNWFDRTGRPLGVVGPLGEMQDPEISPDGKRVAMSFGEPQMNSADIWTIDLVRGTSSRFSFEPSNDCCPVWSGDGSRIYFVSGAGGGHGDIFQKLASGAGGQEPIFRSNEDKELDDVTRDGRFLAYTTTDSLGRIDIWILPLTGERKPTRLVEGPFSKGQARFSPDGHFIAYASDETGKSDIYVVTFPTPTGKWQVSTNGGMQPRWRSDGKEIYYLAPTSKIMAVPVKADGSTFEAGMPADLFETGLSGLGVRNHYTVSADGQKLMAGIRAGGLAAPPMTFVLNWTAALKK